MDDKITSLKKTRDMIDEAFVYLRQAEDRDVRSWLSYEAVSIDRAFESLAEADKFILGLIEHLESKGA